MATASRDGSPLLKEFLGRDPEFLPEFWTLFVLGMIIIILRFPVQIRRVGVKGLEKDDYVGIFTLATWVSTMTMVQQVYHHGSNIDVTQEQVDQLSQSDIDLLIYGSKCQEVAWYCYVSLLWSMKLTILLFYKRLIGHLWHRHVFTMVGIFATMSYTAVILTISLSCRPYPANWQVQPLPSFECAFKLTNLLVTTSLNIATDVAILILALPLLKELNVPIIKKIFVMVLLCSGVFVIAAAIMRLVLTLQGAPSTETINRWGVRECLVGAAAVSDFSFSGTVSLFC
ncbi:hypothetical protein BD289DRAFT_57919 [Coniella lustricola]|uniref:Rhodopsin domain-containing protein n=1 Tax=Coniella lustricola TaxID=2025994 RepID=A0A2T3AI91_9PEZI|nr:hypothetical protein BD289DRAFT_57919 [Coniella lustricola]